jgi:hypothetical protein
VVKVSFLHLISPSPNADLIVSNLLLHFLHTLVDNENQIVKVDLKLDKDGNRIMLMSFSWGDTPNDVKGKKIWNAMSNYLCCNYPTVSDELVQRGMARGLYDTLKLIRKEISDCTRSKMKVEYYPHAYSVFGITYILNGKVLPAVTLEGLKKSWQQDFTNSNQAKHHCFWDHHRQSQALWSETFAQEVMEDLKLVYDPTGDFQRANHLKLRGPKFKDGIHEAILFFMKKIRDSFRDCNKQQRDFKMEHRGSKGLVGAALEIQITRFQRENPVLNNSIEKREQCRAAVELKAEAIAS